MWSAYGKASHQEALQSVQRLRGQLRAWEAEHPLRARLVQTRLFEADALDGQALDRHLAGAAIDVVITDIPYGRDSSWHTQGRSEHGSEPALSTVGRMLEALLSVVSPWTVVAIAADKGTTLAHEGYRRVEHFRLGKRQVALLVPHSLQLPGSSELPGS